ncbi:peptidoglycan-binding protein [Sphingomonas sp. BK069]|uniref:peptidoglycan-binding domain-containing protein n=1 Tax=Sphingomonas sp. BK069 TaxID=2586979 RepID=UPI0016213852|nr:peptidoglycan-binding domain-containing protein [Sphingomonas sp. BK069]MBB3348345.1 hypothetical protein [Sphingomonas sp. BK069]
MLTDSSSATVKVGQRRMTLQQAISQGIVQVSGTQHTMDSVLKRVDDPSLRARMSPAEIQRYRVLQAYWAHMPPAQRAQIERANASYFAQQGDHTRLQFSSRTNQPVEITFGKTALLGTDADRGLATPDLQISGSSPQHAEQAAIWRKMTRRHQALLATSGYAVKVDGVASRSTKGQIARFQRDHKLVQSGEIDVPTEKALVRESGQASALKAVNTNPAREYTVLYVSRNPSSEGTVYQVHDGSGPRFSATTISDIIKGMGAQPGSGSKRVFLVPRGLDERQVGLLAASADNYSRAEAQGRPAVGVMKVSGVTDEAMFQRTVQLDIGETVTRSAGASGAYEKLITFQSADGRSKTVTVVSFARNLMDQFIRNLQALFSRHQGSPTAPTPAQLISLALEQTRRDAGLTRREMKEQLSVEISNTQFASRLILSRIAG